MTAVLDPGAGKYPETVNASPATIEGGNDLENGETHQEQLQFGDQSSRLPRTKIITVSIASSQCRRHLAW